MEKTEALRYAQYLRFVLIYPQSKQTLCLTNPDLYVTMISQDSKGVKICQISGTIYHLKE